MDEADKARLRLAIGDRIDELKLMLSQGSGIQSENGENAKLQRLTSSTIHSAIAKSTNLEVRRLRRSLEWLETDDGGYCEICGGEIASARILAIPSARTCIDCARKEEA